MEAKSGPIWPCSTEKIAVCITGGQRISIATCQNITSTNLISEYCCEGKMMSDRIVHENATLRANAKIVLIRVLDSISSV